MDVSLLEFVMNILRNEPRDTLCSVTSQIPVTYPATAPEIAIPELDGKTAKMYRYESCRMYTKSVERPLVACVRRGGGHATSVSSAGSLSSSRD